MPKKRPNHQLEYRARRTQRYRLASQLKELYPQVAQLIMEMSFRDPNGLIKPSPVRDTFSPEMKAFFDFECPHHECVGGGFDLEQRISEMVFSREPETKGKLACQGWHDREPKEQHRCGLELDFCITAIYKSSR